LGDRVSISFSKAWENGKARETSPVLFSHWGGMDLVNDAYAYVRELKNENAGAICNPLDRLEPGTVMVDFLRFLTARRIAYQQTHPKQKDYYPRPFRIMSDFYLGCTDEDGDNSDNGHHDIKLEEVE
jgi:hypothetical protein